MTGGAARADHVALAARIGARADALAARTLARMYENPFWDARFGERGRGFAAQDQHHHLRYLIIALRIGGPYTMTWYARWLQTVLTTRGMCSRHVDENFTRLAEAIVAEGIEEPDSALALLQAGREALRYQVGPARAVQEATVDLTDDTVSALYARHPEWLERWGEAGRTRCREDVTYHLSYLADGLALTRPDLFASYVGWIAGYLETLGIQRAHLAETLAALQRASRHQLSVEHQTEILTVLAAGRDALRAEDR